MKTSMKLIATLAAASILAGCQTMPRGSFANSKNIMNPITTYKPFSAGQVQTHGVNADYSHAVVADPTGTAASPNVERYELREGDCAGPDCTGVGGRSNHYRERTERGYQPTGLASNIGSEVWYGWDVFFDEKTAKNMTGKFTTALGQIKAGWINKSNVMVNGGCGAPLVMTNYSNSGVRLELHASDVGARITRYQPMSKPKPKDLANKWHRWELQIKWSRGNDGIFNAWFNGEQIANYKGPTYQLCSFEPMMFSQFKTGIYATHKYADMDFDRQNTKPEEMKDVRVVLFDNVSVGKTREELFQSKD